MKLFALLALVGEFSIKSVFSQHGNILLNFFIPPGFAAASGTFDYGRLRGNSVWSPDTEYTYEYVGRLLTGIPELSSTHVSGIGIKCKLNVVVTRSGRIVLHIREAKYARVNEVCMSLM